MMEKNKEFNRKIFQEHLFCDCKLLTDDGWSFDAHRNILASKSQFFYDMYSFFPNDREPVLIPKVRGETLNEVLYFIYTDSVDLNKKNFLDILIVSDFLHIEDLYHKTKNYAESILSTENCFPIYSTSKKINEDHLKAFSIRFMEINFERLINEICFAEIPVEDLKEVLKSNSLRVTEEKVVFEFIEKWAKTDPYSRFKEVWCLLKCLKMEDIDESLAGEIIQSHIVAKNTYCVELEKVALKNFQSNLDALKLLLNISTESPEIPLSDICSRRLPDCVHVIVCRKTLDRKSNPGIYITYDEKLDLWRKLGEFEQFSVNTHIHVLGGNVYAFVCFSMKGMIFSLCDQEWREIENAFEGMQCRFFHSVALGTNIYFIYKDSIDFMLKMKIYNTESGLWSVSMAMPIIFSDFEVVPLLNKIFVVFETPHNDQLYVLVYDEVSNSWFFIDSPNVNRKNVFSASYRDKLYIIGGYLNEVFISEIEVFDIETNEWKRIDNLPFVIEDIYHQFITVFTFKDQLFVILEIHDRVSPRPVLKQVVLNETTWVEPKEPFPLEHCNLYLDVGRAFHTVYDKPIISELVKKSRLSETILEESPFK